MSAPVASDTRSPFSASSEISACSSGGPSPAATSGMARDMGGGMKVYVLCPGQRTRPDLVETFDDAPSDQIATAGEQRACADAWREERKQR